MKKIYLSMFFILAISGCSKNNSIDLILDYVPNTNHTGIYVAKELGYYKDVGIDLNILKPTQNTAETVVDSNNAEFGISYSESITMFNDQNNNLKSIMALNAENTSGIITKKESDVSSPKDLEGLTYCGWGSEVEASIIKTLVENDGGDPSLVNINTSSTDMKIENSPCDAMWVFEGWDVIDFKNSGIQYNYLPLTDYNLDWYSPVLFTSNDFIKNNSQTVTDFVLATIKGYEYAITYPKESADILLKYNPELNPELVYESQNFLSKKYKIDKMGYQNPAIWEEFISWLKENNIVSQELNPTDMYTNDFIGQEND